MFKLCDKTGWTYSFHKTNIGSIMKISWSADGTMCAGASGNGSVIFGEVVDRQLNYENWEANLNDENKIQVTDLLNEIHEELEFKDRVINMSMCYEHLIVTTASQCYIFSTTSWNTPQIFDLKESISIIIQSVKYFCLVESTNGLMIYNYEGKLVSNPKIAVFYFAFLPQFVLPGATHPTLSVFTLGLVFAGLTFFVKGPVGLGAGLLSGWLRSRPRVLVWLYRFSGTVLVGLGLKLAFERRA